MCKMWEARTTGEAVCLPHWTGHSWKKRGTHHWTAHEIGCWVGEGARRTRGQLRRQGTRTWKWIRRSERNCRRATERVPMVIDKRVGILLKVFLNVDWLILALRMSNVYSWLKIVALNQRGLRLFTWSADSFKGIILKASEAIDFCYLSLKLGCGHML